MKQYIINLIAVIILITFIFPLWSSFNIDDNSSEAGLDPDFSPIPCDSIISSRSVSVEQTSHGGSWFDSFEDKTGFDMALSDNVTVLDGDAVISTPFINNLVAFWHFDEESGNTVYDSSGNNNHGTLDTATRVSGYMGKAIEFDGTNGFISIPSSTSLSLTGPLTIRAYVNVASGTDYNVYGYRQILSKGATYLNRYSDYGIGLVNPTGAVMWENADSGNNPKYVKDDVKLSQNLWHELIVTFDSGDVKIYVDRSIVSEATVSTTSLFTSSQPLYIGARYNSPLKGQFQGKIDEVLILNANITDFGQDGNLYSQTITIPEDKEWDTVYLDKTDYPNTYLNITILNATDNQQIPGTDIITTGGEFDISFIDPDKYPSLRLKAEFTGNNLGSSSYLHFWGASWKAKKSFIDTFFSGNRLSGYDKMDFSDALAKSPEIGGITGYLNSSTIMIPKNHNYDELLITRAVPSGTSLNVSVHNAVTGNPILGFTDLEDSVVDLSSINPNTYPAIQLRAVFSPSDSWSPVINDWSLNWTENNAPDKLELKFPANEVFRTSTLGFTLDANDLETPEDELFVEIQYKPPGTTTWTDTYISDFHFSMGSWMGNFTPLATAKIGLYSFRVRCHDYLNFWLNDTIDDIVLVKNNPPQKPVLRIEPEKPRTNDDLVLTVISCYDTEGEELSYTYKWYMNDDLQDDITGNIISAELTVKGDDWRCEVTPDDGNPDGLGTVNSTEVIILNTPPVIASPLTTVSIKEDGMDDSSINLLTIFVDADEDLLDLDVSGQDNVDVSIDQNTGAVKLIPAANWFGVELLLFSANDSSAEAIEVITVTVTPENDAPELLKAGSVEVKSPDKPLEFSVYENKLLNLPFLAEDIDGDTITFSTNRTDNVGKDDFDPELMQLEENILLFSPKNEHVGTVSLNLSISDGNGSIVFYELIISVLNVNNPPFVKILFPDNGTQYPANSLVDFSCVFADPDLLVPDSTEELTFTWRVNTSSTLLKTGKFITNLTNISLPSGYHKVTVTVEDSGGLTTSHSVYIFIAKEKKSEKSTPSLSTNSNFWWLIILVIIVIVIALVIVFLRKRKREPVKPEYIPATTAPGEIRPLPGTVVARPGSLISPTIDMQQVPGQIESPQLAASAAAPVTEPMPAQPAQLPAHEPSVSPPTPQPVSTTQPLLQPHTVTEDGGDKAVLTKDESHLFDLEQGPKPVEKEALEHRIEDRVVESVDVEAASASLVDAPVVRPTEEGTVIHEGDKSVWHPDVRGKTSVNKEILEQLEKLGELKNKGIITQEEFERKKKELL